MQRNNLGFTDIEQRVVNNWNGFVESTALICGLDSSYLIKVLRRSHVRKGIEERAKHLTPDITGTETIAYREDRLTFLTEVMNGTIPEPQTTKFGEQIYTDPSLSTRMKAAELLCKAHGEFSEKHIFAGSDDDPAIKTELKVETRTLEDRMKLLGLRELL